MSSLIATFTGKTGADSTARVRLEQIVPAETSKFANVRDLYQAWLLAASGQPARLYRAGGCPIEFEGSTVRFFLGFYAWPSDPALPYNLTASLGQLGPGQRVEMAREYSEFVDNASIVALPFFMEDITATWETPTYTRYGERIPPPAISARYSARSGSPAPPSATIMWSRSRSTKPPGKKRDKSRRRPPAAMS